MPDNMLPDMGGGTWASILAALGVGGTAIYQTFRKVKTDIGDDKAAAKADRAMDGVLARMEAEISRQNGVIISLTERIDKVEKERNDALAIAAKAQAESLVLGGKIEALEADVAELKAELAEAEAKLKATDTGDRRRTTDWHPPAVDDKRQEGDVKPVEIAAEIVKKFEGCKLGAYRCPAGVWTCGWGAVGPGIDQTTEWSQEEADFRLEKDLLKVERQLIDSISLGSLTDNQTAALISFVYNVGIGNFNTSTMRNLILRGRMEDAADQFPRWNRGGGRVLPGLIARRAAERDLFLSPDEV